ncbi:MAG TPA: hypothetical protein VFG59_19690 [Anaeromyxobacter sp.]|nr:hypothetical protein [Anaeromyxobacter sp.]
MRDRRWDFLYEREKQTAKDYLVSRFTVELAAELSAWPPPHLDWSSEAERQRWSSAAGAHPRDEVIRLALEVARLDLGREFERMEAHLEHERHRLMGPAEVAAVHLVARLATEACLEFKERAERIALSRADLIAALHAVERRLFRVTLG